MLTLAIVIIAGHMDLSVESTAALAAMLTGILHQFQMWNNCGPANLSMALSFWDWKGDQRVILFVRLAEGHTLTEDLQSKIKKVLRQNASPRHVPAKIIQVPEIPYTHNLKKVEIAVTNIIHGRPVLNRDSLSNPKSLDYYEKVVPLLSQE